MHQANWARVDNWWAELFGCATPLLWQGLSVEPHAGLGDYEGILVAARSTGCHVSLPTWAEDDIRESLSRQGISQLCGPDFWHRQRATTRLSVLGPSVHSYTDKDPGGPRAEAAALDDLTDFKIAVGEADWSEGGFADDLLKLFVVRDIFGNSPSRNVAAELGFEPYCQQLAIR